MKLADLFIEFATKGLTAVLGQIDSVQKSLQGFQTGADAAGKVATYAFATATASVGGFVRAGMQGTAVGEMLSFRMGELSRNIAGLFRPEIEKAISLVQSAVNWFRSLSDAQRANIARWIEAGIAGLFVATVFPRITAAIISVVTAIKTATAAGAGLLGWLPLIGMLATAFVGMAVSGIIARDGLGGLWEMLQPLIDGLSRLAATLSRALMPVFEALVPVLTVVVDVLSLIVSGVATIVGWVENLTDALGVNILQWLTMTGVILGALKFIPWLISALAAITSAIIRKTIVQIVDNAIASKGVSLIRDLAIAGAAYGAAKMLVPEPDDKDKKKGKGDAKGSRSELAPSVGGFEAPEAAYLRIAQASAKIGMPDYPKQQFEATQETNRKLDGIQQAIENQKPPTAR